VEKSVSLSAARVDSVTMSMGGEGCGCGGRCAEGGRGAGVGKGVGMGMVADMVLVRA
jgi:hypothetical protein